MGASPRPTFYGIFMKFSCKTEGISYSLYIVVYYFNIYYKKTLYYVAFALD